MPFFSVGVSKNNSYLGRFPVFASSEKEAVEKILGKVEGNDYFNSNRENFLFSVKKRRLNLEHMFKVIENDGVVREI